MDHERTCEVDILLSLMSTTVEFGTVAAYESATRTECNIESEADGEAHVEA